MKFVRKPAIRSYGLLLSAWLLSIACGRNVYNQFEEGSPADEAVKYLEEDNPDAAIATLDDAIAADPANYQLISLLASAKAQKAGVDTVALILNLISDDGSESTSATGAGTSNGIVGLFGVMPDYSAEVVSLLTESVQLIDSIPASQTLAADRFKLSLFYTALMTVRTKQIDLDGDGTLSPEEIAGMDDATAIAILTDIATAESSVTGYNANDGTEQAASQISGISQAIASQEGETQADKLRNYLQPDDSSG